MSFKIGLLVSAAVVAALALPTPVAASDSDLSATGYGSWASSAKFEANDHGKATSERDDRAVTKATATYEGKATGGLTIRTGQGANDETGSSVTGKMTIKTNFSDKITAVVGNLKANGVEFSKVNSQLPNSVSYGGVVGHTSTANEFIIFALGKQPDPRAPTGDCRLGCFVRGIFNDKSVSGTWGGIVNRIPVNGPTPDTPIMQFGGTYTAHR